ncbi:MAG TPA: sigma-54 dependent transcriptional regulator [Vulgatibacter sp.]|nr:sigma-54 dependent transcriptional regulator [Vulgatibacter sp.]
MTGYRILAVDDDPEALGAVVDLLRRDGHEVDTASSSEEAEDRIRRTGYHLVITDLVMPGRSGIELTRSVRERLPDASVLVVTGHANLQTAIAALKAGAADYLTKPVEARQLRAIVSRLLQDEQLHPSRSEGHVGAAARSHAMRLALEKVALAATIDAPVLVRGESGSGKETCARMIHARSSRAEGPFVATHVSALPHGAATPELEKRIAQARGGTLFLDEIEALDEEGQRTLLRALGDERTTPATRVVAATGRALAPLVREGRFREDLRYRLDVFSIDLPPLRERPEDVPDLVADFVRTFASRYRKPVPTVDDDALALLARYAWPGNVRELRNVIEHAVILETGGRITPAVLPRMIHRDEADAAAIRIPIGTTMKEIERTVIARTLDAFGWNKNRTAKVLGISRRSLYNKLERYRIVRVEQAAAPAYGLLGGQPDPLVPAGEEEVAAR